MTVPAQTTPQFTQGGTAFGRTAAQWNAYFAVKVDAQNGNADQLSLTNPIINGVPFPDAPIVTVDVPLTLSAQGELGLGIGSGLVVDGIGALAIGTGAVANAMLAPVPPHSYIGNNTASISAAGYITNTQLTADLALATIGTQGLIPPLSGSAGAFFSGTGGFVVPVSGGSLINGAVKSNGSGVFGQAASTDLSDTTAPTSFVPTDQSGASLTFTGVSVRYTKIGNMITVYGTFTFPSTANGAANAFSLPVAVPNQSYAQTGGAVVTTAGIAVIVQAVKNTSTAHFVNPTSGNANLNSALSTGTMTFILTYPAS